MHSASSKVLRYGVIAGLTLTSLGLIIKSLIRYEELMRIGLVIVVVAPIATLAVMTTEFIKSRSYRNAFLSALTAAVIILSMAVSIIRGGN